MTDPEILKADPILQKFKDIVDVNRPRKFLTLIYVFDKDKKTVLLGRKARGFGEGKWNAFGGKFDPNIDKTIKLSARRELEEECNLQVPEHLLKQDGILFFQYPENLEKRLFQVHCFSVDYNKLPTDSIPTASEEMNPIKWYSKQEVPIDKMWADDEFWLAQYLERHLGEENDNDKTKTNGLMFSAAFDFSD